MTTTLLSCGCALGLGLLAAVAPVGAAGAASQLKPASTVSGTEVRVGDLFDNPGEEAARVIAAAPDPGRQAVFDAVFLNRIARSYRVDWRASSSQDQVVVTRASQVIGPDLIRDVLQKALKQRVPGARLDFTLDNPWVEINIPIDAPRQVSIENLDYAANVYRFTADVVVPSGGPRPKRVVITGRAVGMISAPVLLRRINPGEVIEPGDLGWIETPSDTVDGDFVANPAQVVGLTPRHFIPTNLPLRAHDMEAPRVIIKGAIVMMVLQTPNMVLTAQGRALQAGAMGEVIRVVNTQSNRIVEARVVSANQVAIAQPTIITR